MASERPKSMETLQKSLKTQVTLLKWEDFENAAEMYEEASENYKIGESDLDSVSMMVEAAACYEKINKDKAVEAYQKAIEFYNIQGDGKDHRST